MKQAAYSNGTVFNKGKSRYNELNIKVSTVEVVHRLRDAGLIGFQKGFEGSAEWQGYISRIWPLETLIGMFEKAAFGLFHIGYAEGRETITPLMQLQYHVKFSTFRQDSFLCALSLMLLPS